MRRRGARVDPNIVYLDDVGRQAVTLIPLLLLPVLIVGVLAGVAAAAAVAVRIGFELGIRDTPLFGLGIGAGLAGLVLAILLYSTIVRRLGARRRARIRAMAARGLGDEVAGDGVGAQAMGPMPQVPCRAGRDHSSLPRLRRRL